MLARGCLGRLSSRDGGLHIQGVSDDGFTGWAHASIAVGEAVNVHGKRFVFPGGPSAGVRTAVAVLTPVRAVG